MAQVENYEALLRADNRARRLSAISSSLVITGTIIVILATAIAISYHLYYMKKGVGAGGAGLGKLYFFLSMGVFLVTGILIGGIITYASYRSRVLKEVQPGVSNTINGDGALVQSSESVVSSGEHDKDCFSCMPNASQDLMPGRSLSILERSDKLIRKSRAHKHTVQEDTNTSSAASAAIAMPRFNSDGSVRAGADRQLFSEFYDYSIFALSSTDVSEAQLSEIKARQYKEVAPTSFNKRRVTAFKLGVDSPFSVVTYSAKSGYPDLKQDLHIIRKVKFPWRWQVNNNEEVMVQMPSDWMLKNPADFVDANVFYNVDVPITYCNLLKLMFSYQAIRNGDTGKLFIRYLRFYYSELWDLAIRIDNDSAQDKDSARPGGRLAKFEVNIGLYLNPIGARFAADIAQNYANFRVFIREYKKNKEMLELFGFLESVREYTPQSFSHPADTRSGYLYEVMCAIYGLSCSTRSNLFRQDLTPAMLQVVHYMFFFQEHFRKALIINTIVEETFLDGSDTSFLCELISNLKHYLRLMIRVYDIESDSSSFGDNIRRLYSDSEENKHLLAAMALSAGGKKLGLTDVLESIDEYNARLEEFKNLEKLAINPSYSFNLDIGEGEKHNDVFRAVPYAIVATVRALEQEERASVIFEADNGERETSVEGLFRLYRDMMQLVDHYFLECMWGYKESIIGHGFYTNLVVDKAKGIYALPLKEEFVAVRTVIPDYCEKEETSLQEQISIHNKSESADATIAENKAKTSCSASIHKQDSIDSSNDSSTAALTFSFQPKSSTPSRNFTKISISQAAPSATVTHESAI